MSLSFGSVVYPPLWHTAPLCSLWLPQQSKPWRWAFIGATQGRAVGVEQKVIYSSKPPWCWGCEVTGPGCNIGSRGTLASKGNTKQNQGEGEHYQKKCVERQEIEVRSGKEAQFAYESCPRLPQSCPVQSPGGFSCLPNTPMLFAANTREAGEGAKWVWRRGAGKHSGKNNALLERIVPASKYCLHRCREEFPVFACCYLVKGEGRRQSIPCLSLLRESEIIVFMCQQVPSAAPEESLLSASLSQGVQSPSGNTSAALACHAFCFSE